VARTTRAATAAGAARADFLTANTPGTDASDGSEGGGEGAGNSREGVGMGDFTHKSSPQQANFLTPGTAPFCKNRWSLHEAVRSCMELYGAA
jgi:hypothetical protein